LIGNSGQWQLKVRQPLNLFFGAQDSDRWVPFDRYARRVVRFLMRGPREPRGAWRVLLNLIKGLDRIGVPYRVNDFRHIRRSDQELVCLIGQAQMLHRFRPHTPMIFGPALYDHPLDDEALPRRHAIRQFVVPSAWVKDMFSKFWPTLVSVWPVGIDTDLWAPSDKRKDIDVLVYDKLFHDRHKVESVQPMLAALRRQGLTIQYLRYGSYRESDLFALSRRTRAMIYLSPHETQGIALEQMLSADVPVLAWDPGGDWQNLEYLLRGVRFGPVTSVPYWDDRCGMKFTSADDFNDAFARFWPAVINGRFAPRQMIFDRGLTLETAAQAYVNLVEKFR
jgi:glycosyltransferase involved in cell wall biosynthesis